MEEEKKKDPRGIVSVILGIVSLIIWILPPVGIIFSVSGLILGIRSHRANKLKTSFLGIILSAVGLGLSFIALFYGVYLFLAARNI